LAWVEERGNVCFFGPPGTGKTHCAIALGLKACERGYRVAFATAQEWVSRLEQAQDRNQLEQELRRLERYHLLVVDEVGYLPLERQAANLLFALVSRRYERGSIAVTSNRGFEQWGEILGDAMVAAALIDRLVHHATMIALKGKSYRLRERGLGVAPRPPLRLRRFAPPPERRQLPEASPPSDRPLVVGRRKIRGHRSRSPALRRRRPTVYPPPDGALFSCRKRCTFRLPLTAFGWIELEGSKSHDEEG